MLNNKTKTIIGILIITISSLIIVEYFTGRFTVGPDKISQYIASRQFADGENITRPVFNEEDLSTPNIEIHVEWAPGLSVLATPLFYFFDDIHVIDMIISFLLLFILLFSIHLIIKELALRKLNLFELSLVFLFLSITGTIIFLSTNATTDSICLSLFIFSAYFLIKYFKNEKKIKYLVLACLMIPATVYFRYAYFPALLAIPAFFVWRILFNKTKEYKELIYCILFIALFSIPFLAHIFIINAEAGYVAQQGARRSEAIISMGKRLLNTNPFAMSAFFDQFPIIKLLGYESDAGYDRGYGQPWWLNLIFHIISLIILVPVFIYYKKINGNKKYNSNILFGIYGLIFSLGLIIIIPGSFVFRYFIVPVFIIQLSYFLMIINAPHKKLRYIAIALFVFSFMYSMTLKTYNYTFNYKPFNFEHNTSIMRPNNALINSYRLHKYLPYCKDQNCVAIIDSKLKPKLMNFYSLIAINNIPAIEIDKLEDLNLKTSGNVTVFLLTGSSPSKRVKIIKETYDPELSQIIDNDIHIFSFVLEPKPIISDFEIN